MSDNTTNESLLTALKKDMDQYRKDIEVLKIKMKATEAMIKSLEKCESETKAILGDKTPKA